MTRRVNSPYSKWHGQVFTFTPATNDPSYLVSAPPSSLVFHESELEEVEEQQGTCASAPLSQRIRPNSEAAPWVVEEVGDLERERDELRQWKAEQLAVEATWDERKVGKLLNVPLGSTIRLAIQPAIESMLDAIKGAHGVLRDILKNYECGDVIDSQCEAALAKLQPFIK